MNFGAVMGIFFGAGVGALARWGLGLALNPLFPTLPLGTLAANAIGGLLMGVLLAVFNQFDALPPVLRLALLTGFLGGLTTFSTFSAEIVTLLMRGQLVWAGVGIGLHVGTSLLATWGGYALTHALLLAYVHGARP
ncbi:fluoride efflux transporter CrcB [Thermomonas hydrothermalis]|jgi:CrcB protein|nr:fluoride efflux transporter CrcB [Thermomonas hydrothermalis]MCL6620028.1 fluoride efflux transporter CrcB [Thermomonas hydrothermalis]